MKKKNPPHTHTKSINNKTVFVIFVYKNSMFITDLTKRHCQILKKPSQEYLNIRTNYNYSVSLHLKIDDLCNEIVEELNTSRYRTRYILYSASFWGRLWCFLVLGAPALSVLPLLIVLTKEGEITEQTLTGVCCTLIVVPIVAVSIFLCCCFGKNMIKVCTYF